MLAKRIAEKEILTPLAVYGISLKTGKGACVKTFSQVAQWW
jgi:hypothetical protein